MTGIEIAALISAIGGTAGQMGTLFGGGSQRYGLSDIDQLISRMRRRGASQIGSQVARGKVSTAQSFAGRGFGDSTMATDALAGIEGMGFEALAGLEGDLAGTELEMIRSLAGLQQQESMFKRSQLSDIFGSIADVGGQYLLSRYFPKTNINYSNPYEQFMGGGGGNDFIRSKQEINPTWWFG